MPLAVITAIVFGSSITITFGLCAVWIIFVILHGQSEQVNTEIRTLPIYCGTFIALSSVSGAALFGLLKQLRWRWWAQTAMWIALALVARFALPR